MANTYWVGLAVPANSAAGVASGMIDPRGNWAVGGPGNSTPAIAVTDLHGVDVSLIGRNFRRRTRARMGS